jgi:hypothetical protein
MELIAIIVLLWFFLVFLPRQFGGWLWSKQLSKKSRDGGDGKDI